MIPRPETIRCGLNDPTNITAYQIKQLSPHHCYFAGVNAIGAVDRATAKVEVKYDGNPEFKLVDGTDVYYAANSDKQVLRIKNKYHAKYLYLES